MVSGMFVELALRIEPSPTPLKVTSGELHVTPAVVILVPPGWNTVPPPFATAAAIAAVHAAVSSVDPSILAPYDLMLKNVFGVEEVTSHVVAVDPYVNMICWPADREIGDVLRVFVPPG